VFIHSQGHLFTTPLPSNGHIENTTSSIIALLFGAVDTWLPRHLLAVAGHIHSTILAFSLYVTILFLILILTPQVQALICTLQNSGLTRMQVIAVTFNVHSLILQLFEDTELYMF
jgi:hypothetical protein